MFREYALDPTALSSWERVRYFLDAVGPWNGRLLAQFPSKWKALVHAQLEGCGEVERLRIVEKLASLDRRVFSRRPGSNYDGALPWLDNAQAEHARQAFDAIITPAPREGAAMLDAAEVDARHALWKAERGRLLPREPALFAEAFRLWLGASEHLVLIDPYFSAAKKARVDALLAFCALLKSDRARVEVHFASATLDPGFAAKMAEEKLSSRLPSTTQLVLRGWEERPGGKRLHNRYLLTEIAGVQFGDSVERGDAGQDDRVSILEESEREALWAQYAGPSPAFAAAVGARELVVVRAGGAPSHDDTERRRSR